MGGLSQLVLFLASAGQALMDPTKRRPAERLFEGACGTIMALAPENTVLHKAAKAALTELVKVEEIVGDAPGQPALVTRIGGVVVGGFDDQPQPSAPVAG